MKATYYLALRTLCRRQLVKLRKTYSRNSRNVLDVARFRSTHGLDGLSLFGVLQLMIVGLHMDKLLNL